MKNQTARLSKAITDEGHRLTSSRLAVLETLVESGGHISADELVAAARTRDGNLGRMTVYRTLGLLCDLGLVRPVYDRRRAARIVLLEEGSHHHFVCSRCNRVVEIDVCLIKESTRDLSQKMGFDVQAHLLELYGICAICRE
jgi:Fur family ferric uptake transcriptional regulator